VSTVVDTLQCIIRDELRRLRLPELAVVTALHAHEDPGDRNNYACTVRLRDSDLELRYVPLATERIGSAAVPNVGDLVLVQFLGGDVNAPVITGRLYSEAARPPVSTAGELVYESPDGEAAGVRRVFLRFPNGATLLIDDDKAVYESGQTKLTVNHDGDVQLESAGKVQVRSSADTTIEAQGALSLQATQDVTISGLNVSVKAQAGATLEGGAAATVKGAAVSIKGLTAFSAG
jgi:uncharacterized protein involved in type VI secretion and phage assembly